VDGLIVVASICLVELGGRIMAAETALPVAPPVTPPVTAPVFQYARPIDPEPAGGEGVKLTRPRKQPPSAAERVARAHKQNPDATHTVLAKRLNLSPATVKRHRPKPEPINGREQQLVTAGASQKEN
jgi:hypothetical protein